jgi:hypothetical protein
MEYVRCGNLRLTAAPGRSCSGFNPVVSIAGLSGVIDVVAGVLSKL